MTPPIPLWFYSSFHMSPWQGDGEREGDRLIPSLNNEFFSLYLDVLLNNFLLSWCLLLYRKVTFLPWFTQLDIASEISPPLNGHSGQMTSTGHFLVALSRLSDFFSPGSVGSTILAISCPGWQAQRIREIQEWKDLIEN